MRRADRIVALDEARVVGTGRHEDLYNRTRSIGGCAIFGRTADFGKLSHMPLLRERSG